MSIMIIYYEYFSLTASTMRIILSWHVTLYNYYINANTSKQVLLPPTLKKEVAGYPEILVHTYHSTRHQRQKVYQLQIQAEL
jgi:hypothetical protein